MRGPSFPVKNNFGPSWPEVPGYRAAADVRFLAYDKVPK